MRGLPPVGRSSAGPFVVVPGCHPAESLGAGPAVADRGPFAADVDDDTGVLRSVTEGRVDTGLIARGQVRLQNLPRPGA
jgi:hypothetical protein